MIPMRSATTSRSAAFAPSSRRNRTAPRRSATTSGFIVGATASSGCSAISRSTAPSPHDMTNSPIASSECYISQPRVTGSNLSTRPSTADQFTYVPAPAPAPTVTNINPNTGPTSGGSSVTITGTNFSGATAVSFGSNAAGSFTVNSATQITATSPAGSGTVDVTVTNKNGTSATSSADRFTYGPVAGTTTLSPSPNPTPLGQPVHIAATETGLAPTS